VKIHTLKIRREYFQRLVDGSKKFEIRNNDRNFHIDDLIYFHVIDAYIYESSFPNKKFKIDYILFEHKGLDDGYVILSLSK